MSATRQRLSTDIALLEQRSAELSASVSQRTGTIDAQLRQSLNPLATVAVGVGAGFLTERVVGAFSNGGFTSGRSLGRLGGVLVSLLSSLGSMGAAAAAGDAAASAETATATNVNAPAATEKPADAPF